jgi:hypothetical protein
MDSRAIKTSGDAGFPNKIDNPAISSIRFLINNISFKFNWFQILLKIKKRKQDYSCSFFLQTLNIIYSPAVCISYFTNVLAVSHWFNLVCILVSSPASDAGKLKISTLCIRMNLKFSPY